MGRAPALAGAIAVLALTVCFDISFLLTARFKTTEEHFRLGQHLRATGILSLDDQPAVFRPPGFPAFVAAVLWTRDTLAAPIDDRRAVVLANGLLLSMGAVCLYWHTARSRPVIEAVAVGTLFAFHPVCLITALNVCYPTLHMALVLAATLVLSSAMKASRYRALCALGAGVVWGISTLVRPVSLILPPFVLVLARWDGGKGSWRGALRFVGAFSLGMILAIVPYTLRNHRVTGRLVVVNAQAGFNFWAVSLEETGGDYPSWQALWETQGMPLLARVTGVSDNNPDVFFRDALLLNDAFGREARKNIVRQPQIYVGNVLKNVYRFNSDSFAWWIYAFRTPGRNKSTFRRDRLSLTEFFSVAMMVLALLGLVRGVRRRDTHARVILVVYAMLCVGHSIGFLIARYTYVRLPLVVLAFPLLLRGGRDTGIAGDPLRDVARPGSFLSFSVGARTLWALAVAACAAAVAVVELS